VKEPLVFSSARTDGNFAKWRQCRWNCSAANMSMCCNNEEDTARSRRTFGRHHSILPVDVDDRQFSTWIYTHPGHSRDERKADGCGSSQFSGTVQWRGWSIFARRCGSGAALFHSPFYTLSMGSPTWGAAVVLKAKRSAEALRIIDRRWRMVGRAPLPELFARRGYGLIFREDAAAFDAGDWEGLKRLPVNSLMQRSTLTDEKKTGC